MSRNTLAPRSLSCKNAELYRRAIIAISTPVLRADKTHCFQLADGSIVTIKNVVFGQYAYQVFFDGIYRYSFETFDNAFYWVQRAAILRFIVSEAFQVGRSHSMWDSFGTVVCIAGGSFFNVVHHLYEFCKISRVGSDYQIFLNDRFSHSLNKSLGLW